MVGREKQNHPSRLWPVTLALSNLQVATRVVSLSLHFLQTLLHEGWLLLSGVAE